MFYLQPSFHYRSTWRCFSKTMKLLMKLQRFSLGIFFKLNPVGSQRKFLPYFPNTFSELGLKFLVSQLTKDWDEFKRFVF